MQVYNLDVDEKTHKASATFEYDITNKATNKAIVHTVESTDKMGNVGDQVTLQKTLAAAGLDPGVYRIQIKVNDNISKQTVDYSGRICCRVILRLVSHKVVVMLRKLGCLVFAIGLVFPAVAANKPGHISGYVRTVVAPRKWGRW